MHSSKGLEFPLVVLAGLGTIDANNIEGMREEARLLYVAMTRSTHELVMTCDRETEITRRLATAAGSLLPQDLQGLYEYATREIEEALMLNVADWIRPALELRFEAIPLTRKRAVVAIHVPRSKTKPHFALENPLDEKGQALVRIADNSVRASKETLELLRYEGRERDMKVEYGEKERVLMRYLESSSVVTVQKFAEIGTQKPFRRFLRVSSRKAFCEFVAKAKPTSICPSNRVSSASAPKSSFSQR